ncbi:MAG: HAD-IIIA family hydrolase, partial [Mariprofundales bacterium]|nr:HAD-IIIA family hydrolase [Mariprofundales bacterium]
NFDSRDYILSPQQWRAIPGALHAIATLTRRRIPVAVASNQSAVGRGMITHEQFAAIRATMEQQIAAAGGALATQAYCFHTPDDSCDCRKPKPGLIRQILTTLHSNPDETIMIGDSLRDIEAALAAGVAAALVISGHHESESLIDQVEQLDSAIPIFPDLATAITTLLPSA